MELEGFDHDIVRSNEKMASSKMHQKHCNESSPVVSFFNRVPMKIPKTLLLNTILDLNVFTEQKLGLGRPPSSSDMFPSHSSFWSSLSLPEKRIVANLFFVVILFILSLAVTAAAQPNNVLLSIQNPNATFALLKQCIIVIPWFSVLLALGVLLCNVLTWLLAENASHAFD